MELYTATRGWFTKGELAKLGSALGFPNDIFFRELATNRVYCDEYDGLQSGKSISEENLRYLLESGSLNYRLEKTFNKHDAKYNVKTILKAMFLLHHRQLSYKEISEGRLAFELYSVEDGSGLPAILTPVSQALKLMERIMSPSRLEAEIKKQQQYRDLPSRIQLYEFFELATKCSKQKHATREMEQCVEHKAFSMEADNLDISKLLMTEEQQLLNYLDDCYKASLVKRVDPRPVPLQDQDQRAVSMAPRRILRSLAKEHSTALLSPLERSQQQLHQTRNGKMILSPGQVHATVERFSMCRPNASLYNMDYRGTDRLGNAPLKIPRKMLPPIIEDPLLQSKSAPSILLGSSAKLDHEHSGDDIMEDNDLTAAINKICVGSVQRVRETIGSLFHGHFLEPQHVTTTLPGIEEHVTMVTAISSGIEEQSRVRKSRVVGVALTAIVSKEDLRRHHERMGELEWERLRTSTRQ